MTWHSFTHCCLRNSINSLDRACPRNSSILSLRHSLIDFHSHKIIFEFTNRKTADFAIEGNWVKSQSIRLLIGKMTSCERNFHSFFLLGIENSQNRTFWKIRAWNLLGFINFGGERQQKTQRNWKFVSFDGFHSISPFSIHFWRNS